MVLFLNFPIISNLFRKMAALVVRPFIVKSCIHKRRNSIGWQWCLCFGIRILLTHPRNPQAMCNMVAVTSRRNFKTNKHRPHLLQYARINSYRITLIFIIYYWWLKSASESKKCTNSVKLRLRKAWFWFGLSTADNLGFDDGRKETKWEINY